MISINTPQRAAFCLAYGVHEPRVPLRQIAHWQATLQGLSGVDLAVHHEYAYLAPSYFYLGASPVPDEASVEQWLKQAECSDWLLIPSIEPTGKNSAQVTSSHFDVIKVPFFEAAFFDATGNVEVSLRDTIGRARYKEMVRLTKKAELACEIRMTRLSDLANDDPMLHAFVDLQAINVRQYNHTVNLYSYDALLALVKSNDASHYFLKISYDKHSGVPLQASLSFTDPVRGIFTQLVQGQDRDKIPNGLNLYLSDYYQWYLFAESLGFSCHCLGRGSIDIKKKLGANRIERLDNWLIPIQTRNKESMLRFSDSLSNL